MSDYHDPNPPWPVAPGKPAWYSVVDGIAKQLADTQDILASNESGTSQLISSMEKEYLSGTQDAYNSMTDFVSHDVQNSSWSERSEEVEKVKSCFELVSATIEPYKTKLEKLNAEVQAPVLKLCFLIAFPELIPALSDRGHDGSATRPRKTRSRTQGNARTL
jgi:hypothetical protein